MAMPAMHEEWTVDMLDELPDDGNLYEIIDGELFVTPSPRSAHQDVVAELYVRLHMYLKATRLAVARFSPSDVRREDKRRNRVQPDLFVARYVDGKRPAFPIDMKNVLLVVEVLSPSTATHDHHRKRKLYLDAGIPAYWIIDADARTVSVWRPGMTVAELHTERVEWQPDGMSAPLVVDLETFFREALDD